MWRHRVIARALVAVALLAALPVTLPASAARSEASVLPVSDVFSAGVADFQSSGAPSVIITSGIDVGYAAIAASYAHRFAVPLVLLTKGADTKVLVRAVANAGAKAVLVGGVDAVPAQLESDFKARKVKVVRLAAADRAATAALIATRIRPVESSTAVFAALGGDAHLVAVASAYANALGVPLLAASSTLPRATSDAVAALRIIGGIAIGDTRNISDGAIAALPAVTRVIGKDLASTSFTLVRSLRPGAATLVIDDAAAPSAAALIARSRLGEPQLLLNPGALPTAQQAWLTARGDLTEVVATPGVAATLRDAVASLIANRGAIGALPALQLKPAPAISVPARFTLSGSGFGHGVGMSQWGAYGMAKEGASATAILQHYFTGSVVAPISDTMDVNVSLDSRVPSESFRLERIADPASTLEMTAADGTVRLLAVNDVITTRYLDGKIDVTVAGVTPVPRFSTKSLTFKWAGNRDSGTATGGPAVLRIAGPGVSIASGSRYRYGIVTVTPAKVSGALQLGLQVNNVLRLHDEYLYGIAEVSSSWPAATLQTQVITARSFAYRKVKAGIRSACACNLYDDPRDQNFTGYAKLAESGVGAKWKAAVDGTLVSDGQGLALTVGGQVVSAYYSAATGGMTQNNEDVWGGSPLSYTRSVDDRWSLQYASSSVTRWTPRSFSQAQMAAAFGAPDVAYLDLSNRYASGAVDNAVAIASTGQRYVLGAETLKSRLNAGLDDAAVLSRGIPSVWMWRVDTEVPLTRAADAATQLTSGTTSIAAQLPGATASSVVIVQQPTDTRTGNAILALAAAYAGQQRMGLLVNTGATLDAGVKADLTRRKASRVVIVGPAPSQLVAALLGLKIATTSVDAATPSALAVALAGQPRVGSSAVLVSQQDAPSQAIAVSLAVRTRQPLLLIEDGMLTPQASAWLMTAQPKATTVVGSADAVPDATVAGLGVVSRLTTGSLRLASIIAASQAFDSSTSAVVIVGTNAPVHAATIAAGTGLPVYYVDAPVVASSDTSTVVIDTTTGAESPTVGTPSTTLATGPLPNEVLALVQRLPALTLVFRVGVDAQVIAPLRRA